MQPATPQDAMRMPVLDDKKVFEIHLDALKDAYKELIDANQKIAAILLAVLGWFVAKDNPLSMLCTVPHMAYFAIACTLCGFVALGYLFNLVAQRGDTCFAALVELNYPLNLYARYRLSRPMFWCGLFGQFTLLVGILALLVVKYHLQAQVTCR